MIYDVIIIGGGASGLYLAAHLYGKKVLVIEKNTRLGLKLLASGAGQCNLTHSGKAYALAEHYGNKKKFVKPLISKHDTEAVMAYFSLKDVPLWTREDGKVFPKSMKSKDVLNALTSEAQRIGVHFALGESVLNCTQNSERYTVKTDTKTYIGQRLIIASGGITYPQLGASDIGYKIAESMGHTIVPPHPALAAVYVQDARITQLQGYVDDEAMVLHKRLNKTYQGTLLITHFGLSGPLILDQSRAFVPGDTLCINWAKKTALEIEQMFLKTVDQMGHFPLNYYMNQWPFSDRLKSFLIEAMDLKGEKKLSEITREERKRLVEVLCSYPVKIKRLSDLKEAMATSGGVTISEVNPKTLMSLKAKGLYFIGEVLDVDGDTGGYNLQWAFSSAYAVAEDLLKME